MTILRWMTAITAAILLVACQKEGDDDTWLGSKKPDAPAQHPASAGGTAVVPSVSGGTTVLVMLEDKHLAVRESGVPPGPAVFTITNGGDNLHDLHIEGPGVSRATAGPIEENQSRSVNVTLRAGTYTLYCPILDHRNAKARPATLTVRQR